MALRYAVIGAGRQGTSAAYDLVKFGEAEEVLLVDIDENYAKNASDKVNKLLSQKITIPVKADVRNSDEMISAIKGSTSIISAVPYHYNLAITEIAIRLGANMCDLGGNTDIVKSQLKLHSEAKKVGITIVPDCGMGPGMNISLANYAMSLLDIPKEVYIWDGGLPQNPKPPWNYALTFNIGGLVNEYHGSAHFLHNGQVIEVPCFEGHEELDFPDPLGRLEAFVTSGGLSTMPWTFEGKLNRLENKTLRYPGHWAQFKAYAQLGLLEQNAIEVGDLNVVPRDVFCALLKPKITDPEVRDICVIRVKCKGEKEGKKAEAVVDLIDLFDETTGFTSMQRITGWHASIVAILAACGRIEKGVVPIEKVSGSTIVNEARFRGFSIAEKVTFLEK